MRGLFAGTLSGRSEASPNAVAAPELLNFN